MSTFKIRDLVQPYHRARVFERRGFHVCEHPDCDATLTPDEVEDGYRYCASHEKRNHEAKTNPVA